MNSTEPTGFDAVADYSAELQRGLAVSGEGHEYFARSRIEWLAGQLTTLGVRPERVMDFGCGIGLAAPLLRDILGGRQVFGVDTSEKSIATARASAPWAEFSVVGEPTSQLAVDVVYCNGVFHHIPPVERAAALTFIYNRLRPGGVFSLWENNPWNPGTQLVMRRIPFDRDAIKIAPPGARKLVRTAGFEVLQVNYLFVFPRALRALRPLEPRLAAFPLGAQYQVLSRKPLGTLG